MPATCQAEGCRARAWSGPYCSFHALERQRAARAATVSRPERASRERRQVRAQAAELGLTLASEEVEVAVASAVRHKPRSPVA